MIALGIKRECIGDIIVSDEIYVFIISVADAVAKELRRFFDITFRQIEDNAGFLFLFAVIKHKIINYGIVFCNNARAHRRIFNKGVHFFRSKMPDSVDFFAFKDSGSDVISYGTVGKTGY